MTGYCGLKVEQPKVKVTCTLIIWSLKKNGKMRPAICPVCKEAAEVVEGWMGPCWAHEIRKGKQA